MNRTSTLSASIVAIALLTAGQLAVAEDSADRTKAAKAKPAAEQTKPVEKVATPAPGELVDINSANKQALTKLPGVTAADADKIIAGRPYGSKAHLLSRNILAPDVYQGLNKLVIAKQATNDAGKNAELQKKK